MDGRLQNELRIDGKINKILENAPSYLSEWNENMKASKKTAATRHVYIQKIKKYLTTINKNIKDLKIDDFNESNVEKYMIGIQTKIDKNGELKYTSDSYQQLMWNCFYSFFDFLQMKGYINKNYIKVVKRPKNHDLERINEHRILLTSDDFKKLLDEVEKTWNPVRRARNRAILMVFMNTGMRESALISLMPEDIDYKSKTLYVIDKGNKRHEYQLTNRTINALKDWMDVRSQLCRHKIYDKNIFITHEGKAIQSSTLLAWLRKLSQKSIGVPITPHKLRSGLASILYDQTHDIEFVRRVIGHSNVETTQRYIVTTGDERKVASEIIDNLI